MAPGLKEMLPVNNDFFGKDKPLPEGKKLVMTEPVMDTYLAAHYGIDGLDKVPISKPEKIPKSIHDKLKQHYFAN